MLNPIAICTKMDCCCTLSVRKSEHRSGCHIELGKTLADTIKNSGECECVQIYLGGPTTYQCRTISDTDKYNTLKYCNEHNKTFYVHCPLIANLAKPEHTSSSEVIAKELEIVRGLPAACVLHIGKVGKIETVAQAINELKPAYGQHAKISHHLLLEVAAGQGTELGKNWEELRKLYEGLDSSRVGLCIDTQHAFASGMCSFQTHEDIVQLFDNTQSILKKGISMIHLNDSKKPFGSRVDRHAPLRQGYIWKEDDTGLRSLISMAHDYSIDLIGETSDPVADLAIVRKYVSELQ